MKIFVVMIADRHTDVEAELFSTPEAAIPFARTTAETYARSTDDIEEEQIDGWLYFARYSVEGDAVWVVEKTLNGATDE